MSILLLGPLEVRSDRNQVLDVGHARQRAVLAILAASSNHVVMLNDLIDHLWGSTPPAAVRNTAYSYISRLRRILTDAAGDGGEASPTIVSQFGGYMLRVEDDQVDLHRFRDLVARSREAVRDPEAAVELLREALGLWRGPALCDIEGPWSDRIRDRLEMERISALIECHDRQLRLGQHREILDELLVLAEADPLNERILQNLITALYRCGRKAEALGRFERLRRDLSEQLGVDPTPETRLLHTRVLRSDPTLTPFPTETETHTTVLRTPPRQLPRRGTLFGRDAELVMLDHALLPAGDKLRDADQPAVCAVVGAKGVGKTAFAVHWARTRAHHFPDGQIFLNLHRSTAGPEPSLTPQDILRQVLWSLGMPAWQIPAEPERCIEHYRRVVRRAQILVVLDDASPEQIAPLVPRSRTSALLVTSRSPRLPREIPGPMISLFSLSATNAVRMLASRLGLERVEAEPHELTRIIELCDRLPLALTTVAELAASRPEFSLRELAESLSARPAG